MISLVFCVGYAINIWIDLSFLFERKNGGRHGTKFKNSYHDNEISNSNSNANSSKYTHTSTIESGSDIYLLSASKWEILGDMPLTFDCPILISVNLLGFTICLFLPYAFGKPYFSCLDDDVIAEKFPKQNSHCYVLGLFVFVFIHATYWYMALLSFAIWRYLYNPEKPLFGVKLCNLSFKIL